MKLADEMLLAQMRESVLQDVPEEQWNLVVDEVEKAGGVRQVQGYTRTLIYDAIAKASFGGNRSEAGRYAANVRWQGQDKADRAKIEQEDEDEDNKYGDYIDEWNEKNPDDYFSYENPQRDFRPKPPKEELKEGNLADDLPPSNMPPLYNDYGDEPVNPMPPEYNDYGDEPGDDERAGAKLREAMVPLDTKNPLASQATKTPDSPLKRIALEVKNAYQKNDAAKVVDSARQDAEDAETDLFRAEKDGKSVAGAEKNFAETKALFESAKQPSKERFGSEKMPYQGM